MKITKRQLRQIIKEEVGKILSESERESTLYPIGTKVRPAEEHYLHGKKLWGTVVEMPWNVKSTAHPDHIAVTWQGSENRIDYETKKPYAHLYKPDDLELYDASAEG